MNPNTKYYTLQVNGIVNQETVNYHCSHLWNNQALLLFPSLMMVVPLSSVESQEYFINLGHSKSCHTNLMSDYEYGLAKEVIVEGSSNQTGSQQPQQPSKQPSQQHQQQEKQKGSEQQKIQNSGISLDLTTPTASNLYGEEKKGSLDFSVQNNNIDGYCRNERTTNRWECI